MPVRHPASRGDLIDSFVLVLNVQNGDYTFVAADRGKLVAKQSGGSGEIFTIPANAVSDTSSFDTAAFDSTNAFDDAAFNFASSAIAGVSFAVGTMIAIDNSGGGDLSIVITSDTLIWTFDGSSGTRTLADKGMAVLLKVSTNVWKISGEKLT